MERCNICGNKFDEDDELQEVMESRKVKPTCDCLEKEINSIMGCNSHIDPIDPNEGTVDGYSNHFS